MIRGILLALCFILGGCNPRIDKSEIELAGTPRGGDFSIPSTEGIFTTNDHRGEILFIFFGFSHCPYICPTTLKNLSVMKKSLSPEDQKRLRILFISIDNERDTLESLEEVSKIYGDRIISATDSDHNLREIAIRFGAGFSKRKNKDGEWLFDHTDKVYVINSRGEWVDTQPYNVSSEVFRDAFLKADSLKPVKATSQHRRMEVWGSNIPCDLSQGPCSVEVDGATVTLRITPAPIKVLKPLSLVVESSSPKLKATEVDFIGIGENMGYLRPGLMSNHGKFSGEVTLPICEIQDMFWRARVVLEKEGKSGAAVFSFKTSQD